MKIAANYDIFISYKRKSLPTANNLYYRLTTRGYSTFFDLEELGRDNFNTQLLKYIENAKDVFVILEEGSLDGCKQDDWEKDDWFCHEIAFALEKKKNIIPILLNGYTMPSEDFFPEKLKELSLKNAPEFNYSFFEAYLDKLIEKEYLLSKPNLQEKTTSVFKFYSNENCQVYKEGKLVCSLEGMSEEPYYLPVPRKGDYRFKVANNISGEIRMINENIDSVEEKNVDITWKQSSCNLKETQEITTKGIQMSSTGSKGWDKVKIFSCTFMVFVVTFFVETLIFVLLFELSHRSNIWWARLRASSNGLLNRGTLFIPTQIPLISCIIFYFSSKVKTYKLWVINLLKTVIYVLLVNTLLRFSLWFSYSFIYELCFSAFMTCLFYFSWSILFKRLSKTAWFIPF